MDANFQVIESNIEKIKKTITRLENDSKLEDDQLGERLIIKVLGFAQIIKDDLSNKNNNDIKQSPTQYVILQRHQKSFHDTMMAWNSIYTAHKAAVKNHQKNRLKTFASVNVSEQDDSVEGKKQFTDAELDIIIDSGNYKNAMEIYINLDDDSNDQLKNFVADLEERHSDILMLEQKVLELLELFKDLSILVEVADEKIDKISSNIEKTKTNVDKGHIALGSAEKNQKNYRSKMCCCLLVLALIAMILCLVLFL